MIPPKLEPPGLYCLYEDGTYTQPQIEPHSHSKSWEGEWDEALTIHKSNYFTPPRSQKWIKMDPVISRRNKKVIGSHPLDPSGVHWYAFINERVELAVFAPHSPKTQIPTPPVSLLQKKCTREAQRFLFNDFEISRWNFTLHMYILQEKKLVRKNSPHTLGVKGSLNFKISDGDLYFLLQIRILH